MKKYFSLLLMLIGCSTATKEPVGEKPLDTVYGVFCTGPMGSARCEGRPQGCQVDEYKGFDTLSSGSINVFCNGEWHPFRYDLDLAFPK